MTTTLLGFALPNVLNNVKEFLTRKGFLVQTIPTSNPVLVACQRGTWFRKSKQLIIEVSSVENNLTRIDITAVLKTNRSTQLESNIEKSYVNSINQSLKNVIHSSYGVR